MRLSAISKTCRSDAVANLEQFSSNSSYKQTKSFCHQHHRQLHNNCSSVQSTVLGQVAMNCVVDPPNPGDPSYELFFQEKTAILSSLALRAKSVEQAFNSIEGISCNPVQGAMYAFPKIEIPSKAIEAAKAKAMEPDALYAFELLENTGICIIPGSGFGQLPGTYHLECRMKHLSVFVLFSCKL